MVRPLAGLWLVDCRSARVARGQLRVHTTASRFRVRPKRSSSCVWAPPPAV